MRNLNIVRIKKTSLLLAIISLFSCNSTYHYSGQKESKPVKERLIYPSVDLAVFGGESINTDDTHLFKGYLQAELNRKTYTFLDPNSEFKLSIYTDIAPLTEKRSKDKFLGADNYHVKISTRLKADYELKDRMGKLLWGDTFLYSHGNSEVSTHSYAEAKSKLSPYKLRQELWQGLAEKIVKELIVKSEDEKNKP